MILDMGRLKFRNSAGFQNLTFCVCVCVGGLLDKLTEFFFLSVVFSFFFL